MKPPEVEARQLSPDPARSESDGGLGGREPGPSPLVLRVGNTVYDLRCKVLVMGILNRTPDSFFDKGRYFDLDVALERAEQIIEEGADIIDVGGVKAGPGTPVSPEEEIERVCPVIEYLASDRRAMISVDTFTASVADAALSAGAQIVNDISGLADPQMAEVAARHGATVVVTHIKGKPRVANPEPTYDDLVGEVKGFLASRVETAKASGVSPDRIVVDAGLDLGKKASHSLALLKATDELLDLGHPVLVSASNKPFIGESLGLGLEERGIASLAAACFGILKGARLVRVHDVATTAAAVRMIEAILGA